MSSRRKFHCAICDLIALDARGALEYCLEEAEDTDRAVKRQGALDSFLVVTVDHDGIFLNVNYAMTERMGKSACEIVGSSLEAVFPPSAAQLRRKLLDQAIQSGQPVRFMDCASDVCFEALILPMRNEECVVDRAIVIAQSVDMSHCPGNEFWKQEPIASMWKPL